MTIATAPGKVILFGEHAVVYGRPAIAAPLSQVRARAVVSDGSRDGSVRLIVPDLGQAFSLHEADEENALAAAVRQLQRAAQIDDLPPLTITVSSQIPIASGLGSGAAITAAIIRALAQHLGLAAFVGNTAVSDLTYEVEKIYHGTPSGIDNTVVAFEQPVYFQRGQPHNRIEPFAVARPLRLIVADTGLSSSTRQVVGDVRRQWQANRQTFDDLFDQCGSLTDRARQALQAGDMVRLGRLMTQNHALLQAMSVSAPELERLIETAVAAGAWGAKLSGAGRGGNMIAIAPEWHEETVCQALLAAGARHVLTTMVSGEPVISIQ
ncbi:MAG: mevalonate kinase [Chloroflexota bacterium]